MRNFYSGNAEFSPPPYRKCGLKKKRWGRGSEKIFLWKLRIKKKGTSNFLSFFINNRIIRYINFIFAMFETYFSNFFTSFRFSRFFLYSFQEVQKEDSLPLTCTRVCLGGEGGGDKRAGGSFTSPHQ